MTHRIVVCAVALALTACGPSMDQLRAQAASDLRCPEEQIKTRDVGWYVEEASGCDRFTTYVYDGAVERWISPLERASFDLSCPKEQLRAQQLASNQMAVQGCDAKAVYVWVWGAGWVMDSGERRADAAPQ